MGRNARQSTFLRSRRPRRRRRRGRSRYRLRTVRFLHRRAARRRRPGGEGARALGRPQLRPPVPVEAHHRQPRARRRPQGRAGLRPADSRRHHAGVRSRSSPTCRARSSSASWRWTARCATPTASSRWSRWRRSAACETVYVPEADAAEAALIEGVTVCRWRRWRSLRPIWPASSPSQPFVAGPLERRGRGAGLGRRRLRRHQGPGARQARAGGRRGRRTQPADDRPAGQRQDAACPRDAVDPAADEPGRGAGGDEDLQRRRAAAGRHAAHPTAALPLAAPHRLARGTGRRRTAACARAR